MKEIPTGFLTAHAAANGAMPPMTREEEIVFACQKAAVRAEDERKANPGRQFELEAA